MYSVVVYTHLLLLMQLHLICYKSSFKSESGNPKAAVQVAVRPSALTTVKH